MTAEMENRKRKYPWQRRRMRVLIVIAALIAILFGGMVVWRGYLNHRLNAEYAKIREAGYPITGAELAKWYESVPASLEGSALYERAFESYSDWPQEPSIYEESDVAYANSSMIAEESLELIRDRVEANAEAIALLHEAATKGPTRFRLDFRDEHMWDLDLRYLTKLRQSALLLWSEAVLSAREGETEKALRDIDSMWWVAESMAFDPILTAQLYRLDIHGMLFAAVEVVLNRAELSEVQLLELSAKLGGIELREGFVMALAGGRCQAMHLFDRYADLGPWTESDEILEGSGKYVDAVIASTGLFELNRLAYLRLVDRVIEAAGKDYHDSATVLADLEEEMENANFSPSKLYFISRSGRALSRADARTRIASVVFAVERFRLREDRLPSVLDELVPAYIDRIPTDPFSGLPLEYVASPGGYAVYSFGFDAEDDAGEVWPFAFQGDIVLRVER